MNNIITLGELGKVRMCKRVLKHQTSEDESIPFYKISTFGDNAQVFISKELYREFKDKYPYPKVGDVLISAAGTIGKTVIFDGQPSYFQDSNIVWIENDETIVTNSFLYYFYQTSPWVSTNGSTIKRLYNDNLRSINISYPKLENQKQIAKVLSDLDAKIEVNNQINQQLEAIAKTLYDYWFVQFDFPTTNVSSSAVENISDTPKPYKSSGGTMVYNEELKREIPDGWESGTFGDYTKAKGGYAFKSAWWTETGLSVIKIKDIDENYSIDISNCSYVGNDKLERCQEFQAKAGDVLLAMTGATVGKFGIVPKSDIPILVNQRVAHYRLGENPIEKLPYLINSLSQDYFRETIFVVASGAAQPNISSDQLDAIPLVKPPKEIIQTFNKKLVDSYEKILNNKAENQKLTELRDWLLPMLMNGQIKIKSKIKSKSNATSSESREVVGANVKPYTIDEYMEVEEQLNKVAERGEVYKKGKG